MPNPFNPLDWMRSAQDWFSKTEKSSGFRPYLIYLLLSFGLGLTLLFVFPDRPTVEMAGLLLVLVPAVAFIPLFSWKAQVDPDFCRSESHVQKLRRYELETMGSESKQIRGEIVEQAQRVEASKEPLTLEMNEPESK